MPIFQSKRTKRRQFLKRYRVPGSILLLLLLGLIFWGNISWIFNGDVWRQMLSEYLPQYFPKPYVLIKHDPEIESAGNTDPVSATGETVTETNNAPETTSEVVERRDVLTIPKLGLIAPIITAATTDTEVVHGLLDSGVVLYPGSAPFGTSGQTVILGHSAPTGWPKIKYDWVFSRLNELADGDMVVVTYNNETRYYTVVNTRVVTPQEGVPVPTVEGNSLALVSCWPPGKDLKRIVIETTISND
jgi:LPXTG-site transpeptidase (sortase) family protein